MRIGAARRRLCVQMDELRPASIDRRPSVTLSVKSIQ
jgi:hypothetical protein